MKLVNFDKLLPADIPAGERVVWHGRPEWFSLARKAYRGDLVAIYFALMTVGNFIAETERDGWRDAIVVIAKTILIGGLALSLIGMLAWLSARTTLYVITSRRIVMKIGIALPVFFNIPFAEIQSAASRAFGDGTGDVPLALAAGRRIAYLHLWPHARPFMFTNPQPALRSIPKVADVAVALRAAMVADLRERVGPGVVIHDQSIESSEPTSFPSGAVAV